MLETILLTILITGLLIAGMSIGAIFRNKPIKGTCGGLNALGMDTECEICGGDREKCDNENISGEVLAKNDEELELITYDAIKKK